MVANLILWHFSRASCKGWSSCDFSSPELTSPQSYRWKMTLLERRERKKNSMFWFLASEESGEWYISLLCYFASAMPLPRLYRIICVSLINNFLKVFLCSANKKAPISIAGTARKRQLMQKLFGFFPLTQIMHSCSNSIRKFHYSWSQTINAIGIFFRVIPQSLEFAIKHVKSMGKYFLSSPPLLCISLNLLLRKSLLSPLEVNIDWKLWRGFNFFQLPTKGEVCE